MLEKNVKLEDTFAGLGCREVVSEDTATEIEGFVCTLYGLKRLKSVDEARFELFQKKYKTSEEQTISFKNKLDSSYIPPCKRVLVEKINRTNYIAAIWKSATCSQPPAHFTRIIRMDITEFFGSMENVPQG